MNIPIFFSSNDYFIPYVSVMMQSIMENALCGRKYEFYILYRDINAQTMEILQKQVSLFSNFSLKFVDMSGYVKNYDFFVSRHITIETYFRLFIPYIYSDMDKAIYLDGDMICLADISQLFDIDVSDYLVAGTRDTGVSWYYGPPKIKNDGLKKQCEILLNMKHPENYINAGMLLLNCRKIREKYTMKHIIDTINSREWQIHDQDVINVLAEDNILHIHKSWDYLPEEDVNANYLPDKYLSEYLQAQKEPKIVHYKPYAFWYYIRHFDEFWKYATRTPFGKEIVVRMNANGIIGKQVLEDKMCFIARAKTGFGGRAILKTFFAFLTRRFRRN